MLGETAMGQVSVPLYAETSIQLESVEHQDKNDNNINIDDNQDAYDINDELQIE